MTAWALALILAAAFIHASWNLLNKRASGHATFTWLVAVLSALFYAPVAAAAVLFWQRKLVGWRSASWREARRSTLAILCSSTRVTAPAIFRWFIRWREAQGPAFQVAAILFFGERPSVIALAGATHDCRGRHRAHQQSRNG